MFNKMFECFNSLVTNRNCAKPLNQFLKTAYPVSHICSTKCLNVLIPPFLKTAYPVSHSMSISAAAYDSRHGYAKSNLIALEIEMSRIFANTLSFS